MKIYQIKSKTFGLHNVLLDNADFELIIKLGGKWCLAKKRGMFYPQKRINHKIIEMHRYILNPPKDKYVDHINSDTLDNRRNNLRICSNGANLRNGRIRKNNKSGFSGVTWDKSRNKWQVRIKVNYKTIHLGRFDSFEQAVKIRKEASKVYWE
jgi:hypothetical protein